MLSKRIVVRIAILIVGLIPIELADKVSYNHINLVRRIDHEVMLIRELAASGDPDLANVLDASMVLIPAGEFYMGSDDQRVDERPQRQVYLDAFEIDRYEVANAQYQRFVEATGRKPPLYWNGNHFLAGQADIPVVGIGWQDADAYCEWAGKRLPTEAEWEKACRGADGRRYPWGDEWHPNRLNTWFILEDLDTNIWDVAWSFLQTGQIDPGMPGLRPVGTFLEGASPYGVMDLAGNASEWVWDWYNWSGYWDLPARNPKVEDPPWNHSLRGSAWFIPYGDQNEAQDQSRCSRRNSSHAAYGDARTGFRCAQSVTDVSP
jgi:formylglycine-generating enzyme